MISKKVWYGWKCPSKYLIESKDNGDIRPLFIKLLQKIEYVKYIDSNKTMTFRTRDEKLLKTFSKIWKIN